MNPRKLLPPLLSALVVLVAGWLLLWLLSGAPTPAHAATLTVCPAGPPACDYATIQEAVDAAQEGDVVKVAEGTYTDLHLRPAPPSPVGPTVITQVIYITKSLTIRGGYTTSNGFAEPPDPVEHPTVLDPAEQGRGIYVGGYVTVSIAGLEITRGKAPDIGIHFGSGICVLSATATISECRVYSNTGAVAVFLLSSRAVFQKNAVTGNASDGVDVFSSWARFDENSISSNRHCGLGAAATGEIELYRNTLSSNSYSGLLGIDMDRITLVENTIISNSAPGIQVHDSRQTTLISNTIALNTALSTTTQGGGVRIITSGMGWECFVTLTNNIIVSNTASTAGGGIYMNYGAILVVTGNTILGNQAAEGGGLYARNTRVEGYNNTVSLNRASGDGGGLYAEGVLADWRNNIVSLNRAGGDGGGLYLTGYYTMANNVVTDNQAGHSGSGLYLGGSAGYPNKQIQTTVARNTGGDGSGIAIATWGYDGSRFDITNTVIASQTIGLSITAGSNATLSGVLWYNNATNTAGPGTFTITHALTGNPAFALDGYHLLTGSAAIDAGIDSGAPDDIDGEPRPYGVGYDLGADEYRPFLALTVGQAASADLLRGGEPLTFTLYVTNTGAGMLHPTVVDTLPDHVTPTGALTWTLSPLTPGEVWSATVAVQVEYSYSGPLINRVQAATVEGVGGESSYTVVVERVYEVYLPVVCKASVQSPVPGRR